MSTDCRDAIILGGDITVAKYTAYDRCSFTRTTLRIHTAPEFVSFRRCTFKDVAFDPPFLGLSHMDGTGDLGGPAPTPPQDGVTRPAPTSEGS